MPNSFLPQLAARAGGIYERYGLAVDLVDPAPGPTTVAALAGGDYDVCQTSVPYYLWARDEHPDVDARFVFMLSRRTHMTAFVVEDRPAAHGRPIRSVTDLAGASLAMRTVPAPGRDRLKLRMFHAHESRLARDYWALLGRLGLEAGPGIDVGEQSALEAMLAGDADVAVEWVELGVGLRASAAARGLSIRSFSFADAGVPGYLNGFVAGDAIRERPEALGRFVAALRDAVMAVRSDPGPALDLLARELPDRDRESVLERWRLGEPAMFVDENVGSVDAAAWEATLDYHVATHGTRPFDPATAFDAGPSEWARLSRK